MPFETLSFAVLLAIALAASWLTRTVRTQNLVLIAANYVFCGWLDARFVVVLAFVSATSFLGGLWITAGDTERGRRWRLMTCLTTLASTLLMLKYGEAAVDALGQWVPSWEGSLSRAGLSFFVPIGLSYYVLQTAGYCIDVFRGRSPERRLTTYFAYVGFFPYLVSGPIAQAATVLPQFESLRRFTLAGARDGIQQIIWGLFKKLIVADSLALTVDYVFARHADLSASTLAIGVVMYSFQIYADFSGYSDIAIGLGRLFGFSLPQNFNTPYFSRSVGEFWRRWHMSLSAWLRAYIYLPLGGRGSHSLIHARNILLVFGLSGLWHNMTWNFLAWGLLNGVYFMPAILLGHRFRSRRAAVRNASWGWRDTAGVLSTFGLVALSRVFFRAPDMSSAVAFYRALCDWSVFSIPDINLAPLGWVAVLMLAEGFQRFGLPTTWRQPALAWIRYPAFAVVVYLVVAGLATNESRQFLYARF